MVNETGSLDNALTRLDRVIAETEQRLVRLRAMRENVQPFIEQYLATMPTIELGASENSAAATDTSSFTDEVLQVFRQRPEDALYVDDVVKVLHSKGSDASRDQTRNAINYVVRLGKVHRAARRGTYTLKSTSTPVAPGVDVSEEPNSEGSS